jgi:putative transposase
MVAPNHLKRLFDVKRRDEAWVTDITMVWTYEGWLYVAVVLDLFSRQVIGWSIQSRMEADLVVRALLMAVWRRQPESEVLVHSDRAVSTRVMTGRIFSRIIT